MNRKWIGLDIGGTKCAAVLAEVDEGIHVRGKVCFDTQATRGFEAVYTDLMAAVEQLLRENGIDMKDVQAIGVSCGGPLDSKNGVVLSPPNLPGWVNIPLCRMLEERFGVPAFLQNDANACALVEWKLGAGHGAREMVFLTMGTGMGAGIIAEGRLLCGRADMAGEVGHVRLTPDGPVGFGKAGSFEGYTSGGGIERQAWERTKVLCAQGDPPAWIRDGHAEGEISAKLLAAYARAGDAEALAIFERVGTRLGQGLAMLADILNPEVIVIGSIFARCEDLIRPAMERELEREVLPQALACLRVVPAVTGDEIGDLASVMAALYGMDVDPMEPAGERDERVLKHYDRLFARYPALDGNRETIMDAYLLLRRCYERGGKLLLVGNGGSCADCGHIVGELMKGFYLKRPLEVPLRQRIRVYARELLPKTDELLQRALPAIALTEHPALSTAVQNDLDPLLSAAQQVIGYGKPGDVLIAISSSGNAKNALLAAGVARAIGMSVIALTGEGGGRLKPLCDCTVAVPASSPADAQELHLPVYHTLCAMLETHFFSEKKKA